MFKIETAKNTIYKDRDGNHWSTERDARESNAEIVAVKMLGQKFFDKSFVSFTTVRNLSREALGLDLRSIAETLRHWLAEIEPQFAAIEGEVGYRVGPNKSENRLITLDDGTQHASREDAASHVLMCLLNTLRPRLTDATIRALCNVSKYAEVSAAVKQCSQFSFETGLRSLLSFGDYRAIKREQAEKVADVLDAMYEERVTPVAEAKR